MFHKITDKILGHHHKDGELVDSTTTTHTHAHLDKSHDEKHHREHHIEKHHDTTHTHHTDIHSTRHEGTVIKETIVEYVPSCLMNEVLIFLQAYYCRGDCPP